ncbi:E3 ubiquitin-protein ligase TRIM21-like [Clarias gariepinus]
MKKARDMAKASQARDGRRKSMDTPAEFAGDSSSLLTEEQLKCFICLEVFTDPITTPCGHSFCKSCIIQSWNTTQNCYCPYCKEKFTKRPELKINVTMREVADCFKKKISSDKSRVFCEICPGAKEKAIKSCLDCGVNFCESHLEPHNIALNYKKHKLINAVKNLERYICQKHKRPLELFCRDDQECVCQFCTEGDHKNHKVITLEEESGQRKSQLGKTQTELQQMIQDRQKKIEEINDSVELSKRKTDKEKSDSVEFLTNLIRFIERSQAEQLEMMEEKQKAAEQQADGLIKELQQEITDLETKYTELEQLSHTDDHLHFLQRYTSLCRAPHTRNWSEIRINIEVNVDTMRMALSHLQQTLNKKLSRNLNENLKETGLKMRQEYAVDVSLDPDTANPYLILSNDGKQVTYGDTKQNLSDTPKRFSKYSMVLGKQGFSSGRFYYEVQVSGKTEWDLGVVKESVNRKGTIETFKPQNGFWTLILRKGNKYTVRDDPSIPLPLSEKLQKVGVFVDYEEGLVSFYDVETSSLIYSFTGQSFTEKLYPYFSPALNDGGKNSSPLVICHVSRKTE